MPLPWFLRSEQSPLDDATAAGIPRGAEFFRTDDLRSDLGRKTARGGAYTVASTGVNFVVSTGGMIVLARLLTPDDFGLIGMVTAILAFATLFKDIGLSRAVVQRPEITHGQVSTLFWINVALSTGVATLLAAATPLIVTFYDEPRLTWINVAMAGMFLISGLSLQHRALLERRMHFGVLTLTQVVSVAIGTAAAIAAATAGLGYWSLVILPAVTQVVTMLILWGACTWRPGPPRRGTGVRPMLAFGGHVTGFQVLNTAVRNVDNILIGWYWGAAPLGLYTRAYALMMLPAQRFNGPMTSVAVPALARMVDQPSTYRNSYTKALNGLAMCTAPAAIAMGVVAPELIPLVLGEQWTDAVAIFIALVPAAVMAATNVAAGWVYLSYGHVHRQWKWSLIEMWPLVIAMVIGLQWGALGVAIGVSVTRVVLKLPGLAWAYRGTPLRLTDFLSANTFPLLLSALTGLAGLLAYFACAQSGIDDAFPVLAIKLGVMAAAFFGCVTLFPQGRASISRLRQLIIARRLST